MKITPPLPKNLLKPLTFLLIAIPSSVLIILTIAPNMRSHPESQLQQPYRYPFNHSLPNTDNRRATLSREIAFYQQKVHQNPDSGLQTATLARSYLKMAKATGENSWYLLAEQTAQRSLTNLSFHNNGAILVLARIAQARHDFTQAIKLAQQVLKTEPDNEDALAILVTTNVATGKLSEANRAANTLVDQIPTLGSLTLLGLVQTAQGQDAAAVKTFTYALSAEEPGETASSAWTRVLLGRHHYKHGRLQQAEDLYREAVRILPRYPLALLHLAELQTRQGKYSEAESLYDQVIPNSQATTTVFDHVVLRGKARIKQLQGKDSEAKAVFTQAEALLRQENAAGHNHGHFGHHRELAQLLLERGNPGAVAEAVSLMQEEVGVRRDAQTLDTYAWALSRAGRWQEAQQVIQEALQLGTRDAGLFYRAASVAQQMGNVAQAQVYRKSAAAVDPSFDEKARLAVGVDGLGL